MRWKSVKNNEILLSQSLRISSSIIEEYYLKDSLEFNLLKRFSFISLPQSKIR